MADTRALRHEHAGRRVWSRGAAGRRGDDDPRALSLTRRLVTLYVADGCHLCDDALAAARAIASDPDLGVELRVVDITGDEALERLYRVEIPVLEIDGARAFRFEVDPDALRDRLLQRFLPRRPGDPGRM